MIRDSGQYDHIRTSQKTAPSGQLNGRGSSAELTSSHSRRTNALEHESNRVDDELRLIVLHVVAAVGRLDVKTVSRASKRARRR